MKKFKCNNCHFNDACTFNGDVKPDLCVISKKFIPNWHEVKEEVKLKKLTADVFERPDCPEWARYAAVDKDGKARFHAEEPIIPKKYYAESWCSTYNDCFITDTFDASDWQNSLIERPVKALPDWCKVGAIGYDNEQNRYFEVTNIDKKWVDIEYLDDGNGATFICNDILQDCSEARKRPFNEKEMKALLGKVIVDGESEFFVSAYYGEIKYLAAGIFCEFDAQSLMRCICEGKPCYVLEHLENGEWVE